jgi:hypothetical protein
MSDLEDGFDDRGALEDDTRVPVVGLEDNFAVGAGTDVGHTDLLDGVVLVALDREHHDPDGVDALDLLVAVPAAGIPGVELLRVATDDVLGKAGAAGLEVIDARLLRAILPWMDLPRFIGGTLSLHPTPKEFF